MTTGEMRFRLGELLGDDERCSFVSLRELDLMLVGRLSAKRQEAIVLHGETCPHCSELLEDVRLFKSAGPDAARRPRRFALALGLGAAAAALVVVVFLALFMHDEPRRLVFPVTPIEAELVTPRALRGESRPPQLIDDARALISAGEYERAETLLADAARQLPDNAPLQHNLGLVRWLRGDAEGALAALRRAEEVQAPLRSQETSFWLAVVLGELSRDDEACEAMRSAAALPGPRAERAAELAARHCGEAARTQREP